MSYDGLDFKSYVVPAVAFDSAIVPGPCVVRAIVATTLGNTDFLYTLWDGLTAGGTVIWQGAFIPMIAESLDMRLTQGLYLRQTGTGLLNGWSFVVAVLPPDKQ